MLLSVSQPSSASDLISCERLVDPGNEQEVPKTGLGGRRARHEQVREDVPDRAEPDRVERARLNRPGSGGGSNL